MIPTTNICTQMANAVHLPTNDAFRVVTCRLNDGGSWVHFIERVDPLSRQISLHLLIDFQHLHQYGKVPPC